MRNRIEKRESDALVRLLRKADDDFRVGGRLTDPCVKLVTDVSFVEAVYHR